MKIKTNFPVLVETRSAEEVVDLLRRGSVVANAPAEDDFTPPKAPPVKAGDWVIPTRTPRTGLIARVAAYDPSDNTVLLTFLDFSDEAGQPAGVDTPDDELTIQTIVTWVEWKDMKVLTADEFAAFQSSELPPVSVIIARWRASKRAEAERAAAEHAEEAQQGGSEGMIEPDPVVPRLGRVTRH